MVLEVMRSNGMLNAYITNKLNRENKYITVFKIIHRMLILRLIVYGEANIVIAANLTTDDIGTLLGNNN